MTERFLPVVLARIRTGGQAEIREADLKEIRSLLAAFAAYGSPELAADIQAVQAELRRGRILEQFGIVMR